MKLSIQIVNFRSQRYLEECLFSVGENLPAEADVEILVVNNDERVLNEFPYQLKKKINFKVFELGKNFGFGKAHNICFENSQGDCILFLNPDTKILPGSLKILVDIFKKDEKIGIASPLLVDTESKIQPNCFGRHQNPLSIIGKKIFPPKKEKMEVKREIFEADWVSGGAMMIRRSVFEKAGGFDENFFMYFEDVDLCRRVKKMGYKIVVNPAARVFHESGKSFASEREKKEYYYASQDYYIRKHFGQVAAIFVKVLRFPYYMKNVWLK